MKTHISVIIPAHNEEKYIKRCMDSIKAADSVFPGNTEIIVVCNRCTDRTESIAAENGAATIINEDRCIAKVRNAGIEAAKGRIIVTIDADNRMTKNTLREIYSLLRSGKYIGGGIPICPAADVHDGKLNLVMIDNVPRWRIPFYLPGLMLSRDLKFRITKHVLTDEVAIEGKGLRFNIDGDIRRMDRAEFRICRKSLMLIC